MDSTKLQIIVLITMGILLLVWLLICMVIHIQKTKRDAIKLDFDVLVKCDKCGTQYHKRAADFVQGKLVKQKSVTKTRVEGATLVNQPDYLYFGKKFDCPCCHKRVFGQVLNIEEIQSQTMPIAKKNTMICLVSVFIGGVLIIGLTMIPMAYVKHLRAQEVQELKDKQQQEIREMYSN